MAFKMKYEIESKYLTPHTKRRPSEPMNGVKFIVAHDTGNPSSTALGNVKYYENTNNVDFASAQLFVDDNLIVECIPTGLIDNLTPEKAWHVVYNTPIDNQLYGYDANDYAIGVEYCYGGNIDAQESYKRYIWVMAYICYKYGLDPSKDITAHYILDPSRKTDPKSGLNNSLGITFEQCVQDVVNEYNDCLNNEEDDTMKFNEDWQWKMLGDALDGMYKKCLITDYTWATKAYNREMTQSELAWLNTILYARQNGIEI